MLFASSFCREFFVSRLFPLQQQYYFKVGWQPERARYLPAQVTTSRYFFSSKVTIADVKSESPTIRLSKLLSQHATNLTISRNQAETLIRQGQVTIAGKIVQSPQMLIDQNELSQSGSIVVKVQGKGIQLDLSALSGDKGSKISPIVYAVHKVAGEMVTENDPQNRPSMLKRLRDGGVGNKGKRQFHLKPVGRLDMPTEGLILVTSSGDYARELELPKNQLHRVYRARVHGRLTSTKLNRIRAGGVRHENIRYGPMKVAVEAESGRRKSTNTWVQITSIEGKNRQIRNVFAALGVTVTRLIRIAYGDYVLQTIPPGLAIEVPYKPVKHQKARGPLRALPSQTLKRRSRSEDTSKVKWVRSVQ